MLQDQRTRPPELSSTLILAAALLACAGCNRSPAPVAGDSYGAYEPSHPAMEEAPSAPRSGSAADPHGAEAGAGQLPPGHPPIRTEASGGSATASPAAEVDSAAAPGELDAKLLALGIKLQIPAGWNAVASTSSMRLATFRLDRAEGDPQDAEVSLMALPASQTEEANILRWRSQFQGNPEAKTATRENDGIRVTTTEVEGTFTGTGTAEADTRLWGAIVRVPESSELLFLKAWGPKATLEKWKGSFDELVASIGSPK